MFAALYSYVAPL